MLETYVSAVALSECDEMGHMNIQHFASKAADATAVLYTLSGLTAPVPSRVMHLRFHRELMAGDRLRVRSGLLARGSGRATILHLIENAGTNLLAATCIAECVIPDGVSLDCPQAEIPDEAKPRTLTDTGKAPTAEAALEARMVQTHLSPVSQDDIVGGDMKSRALLGRISRSQAHLWALAGLDRREQTERGLGTATLEIKLERFAPITAGVALRILTGFAHNGGKPLHYTHHIFDAARGTGLATVRGVGIMLDLATRRAILPPIATTQFA